MPPVRRSISSCPSIDKGDHRMQTYSTRILENSGLDEAQTVKKLQKWLGENEYSSSADSSSKRSRARPFARSLKAKQMHVLSQSITSPAALGKSSSSSTVPHDAKQAENIKLESVMGREERTGMSQEKGTRQMEEIVDLGKDGEENPTLPEDARAPLRSLSNHLTLPFDIPLRVRNPQSGTKTSFMSDEDDMTVWQLGFVNLSRAIHEDREIDTSFLKLDHKLKVRDYRAAQADGNGGSAAVVENLRSAEAVGEGSTALKIWEQAEGLDQDKPKSRGAEVVRTPAGKDKGDEEVVIEVQICRCKGSEIVLDLSAMEARRVKVKVKSSG
ncbi:hypothetical protein V866_001171 [Kwoniella sp. B9012]